MAQTASQSKVIVVTSPDDLKRIAKERNTESQIVDKVAQEIGRPSQGSPSHIGETDDYFLRLQALGISRDSLLLEAASIALSRDGRMLPLHKILEQSRISGAPIPDYENEMKKLRKLDKINEAGDMKVTVGNKLQAISLLIGRPK